MAAGVLAGGGGGAIACGMLEGKDQSKAGNSVNSEERGSQTRSPSKQPLDSDPAVCEGIPLRLRGLPGSCTGNIVVCDQTLHIARARYKHRTSSAAQSTPALHFLELSNFKALSTSCPQARLRA